MPVWWRAWSGGWMRSCTPPATWVDESLEPNPEDIYDRTKLAAEAYHPRFGIGQLLRLPSAR
jgi:hypothetical protein